MQVREIMTNEPACCTANTPLPEVARLMVEHDCGEIPVVDEHGSCCGMVAQADVAQRCSREETGEMVREVSRRTGTASRAGCC